MNRIAVVSIYDIHNLGNRLQNYAAIRILSKYGKVENIVSYYNDVDSTLFKSNKQKIKTSLKMFLKFDLFKKNRMRNKNFEIFNKNIPNTKKYGKNYNYLKLDNEYDLFFVGSDQIWNRWLFPTNPEIAFCGFAKENKRVAFMPSVCMDNLSEMQKDEFKKYLKDYKALSCREGTESEMLSNILNRKVHTLVDPTLMLSQREWRELEKKPDFHDEKEKYMLIYFLGKRNEKIESYFIKVAEKYNLKIVDLLDKDSNYYTCGPKEFIYLIRNCQIMFTDSFHGSVFSYIFDKPFKNFVRSDIGSKMNTRLENLLSVLHINETNIEDLSYVDENLFTINYQKEYLQLEQKKVEEYLDNVFIDL